MLSKLHVFLKLQYFNCEPILRLKILRNDFKIKRALARLDLKLQLSVFQAYNVLIRLSGVT